MARRCGARPCLRQRVSVLGQRPVSGASVQHHATAVRCPVRTSERPDVRRPVSSVGVRSVGSRVHCVRPGGGGGCRWGMQPHGWDGRSAWSPAVSTACPSAARVGTRRSTLAKVRWVSGGVGLDLAVVVGGGWAVARSTAWATRTRPDMRRDRPLVASWGTQRDGYYSAWSSCAAQGPSRLVAASLLGWAVRLARAAVVRPQPAVSTACSTLATL